MKRNWRRDLAKALTFVLVVLLLLVGMACREGSRDERCNVVLISLDTVRYDALGFTGNQEAGTPNIDALAGEGCSFAQAVSTNSLTTPAHCSLFTGRYPTAHGVHNIGLYALSQKEKTLAEFLKENGYETAAFVAAFPVSQRFGLSQGFTVYDERFSEPEESQKANAHAGDFFAERPAAEVADAAIDWVNDRPPAQKPFFLFLHFFDAHVPYNPPPDYVRRFGTSPKQRYAGEIACIDSELKKILSALEKKKVRDRTIFIVTSDHGEAFGDHGEDTHGIFIYDSTIRVPLVFSGGPVLKGRTFHEQASLVDIFPTVADLLDLPVPKNLHGRSLKNLLLGRTDHLEDHPCYMESFLSYESFGWAPLIGMRTSAEKLIRAPRPELYAFNSDPLEEKNIYQQDPGHAKSLEDDFTGLLKCVTEESTQSSAQLSGQELEFLHSLGYIGAGIMSGDSSSLADPKDRIGLYMRMKAAQAKLGDAGEAGKAMEELKALAKEDPGNMTLRLIIGNALKSLDRADEAESYFRSLISEYPGFTLALNELATLLLKGEKWEEAARHYQKSLEIDPLQMELYPNLVYALSKMNRLQEAISLVDRVLTRHPGEASLHAIRGELAYQTKDYAASVEHFAMAYRSDQKNVEAAQNYARALLVSGQAAQGVEILKPFASRRQEDVEFQVMYGQCLAQVGRCQEAMGCFEKALRREERPVVHYFMGLCLLKMGKADEAMKHFDKLDRNDPNYEMSRRALDSIHPGP